MKKKKGDEEHETQNDDQAEAPHPSNKKLKDESHAPTPSLQPLFSSTRSRKSNVPKKLQGLQVRI